MNSPHIWSMQIQELSASHYLCRSQRDSGHIVSYESDNEPEMEIAKMILAVESSLTDHSLAILSVLLTFNRSSKYLYDHNCFGSWWIENGFNKITYDGKDGWLTHMVNGQNKQIMSVGNEIKYKDLKYCINAFKQC